MSEFKIKIEGPEYDDILVDLADIALELWGDKNGRVILRLLSLLLHGEWVERE